jgi:hypothetical protein
VRIKAVRERVGEFFPRWHLLAGVLGKTLSLIRASWPSCILGEGLGSVALPDEEGEGEQRDPVVGSVALLPGP